MRDQPPELSGDGPAPRGFARRPESLLQSPHVGLFECSPVTDELILLAHDPRLILEVEAEPF